jgi:hypothetical protein
VELNLDYDYSCRCGALPVRHVMNLAYAISIVAQRPQAADPDRSPTRSMEIPFVVRASSNDVAIVRATFGIDKWILAHSTEVLHDPVSLAKCMLDPIDVECRADHRRAERADSLGFTVAPARQKAEIGHYAPAPPECMPASLRVPVERANDGTVIARMVPL